jgi:hypothetical protein
MMPLTAADKNAIRLKYAEEREKRLRADGNAQYQRLEAASGDLAADPHTPVLNRIALLLGLVCLPTLALANDLIGFWKADEQPAWIEIHIDNESTTGIVRRNDVNPDAVGRTLLKNVIADGSPGVWRGQIYAARLGDYRDAEITLLDPASLQIEVKMGFRSRAFIWKRVAQVSGNE